MDGNNGEKWRSANIEMKHCIRGGLSSKVWPMQTKDLKTKANIKETFVLVNEVDDWLHHVIWGKSRRTRNFSKRLAFKTITDAIVDALALEHNEYEKALTPVLMGADDFDFLDAGLPAVEDNGVAEKQSTKKSLKKKKASVEFLLKDVMLEVELPKVNTSQAPVTVLVWSEGKSLQEKPGGQRLLHMDSGSRLRRVLGVCVQHGARSRSGCGR